MKVTLSPILKRKSVIDASTGTPIVSSAKVTAVQDQDIGHFGDVAFIVTYDEVLCGWT